MWQRGQPISARAALTPCPGHGGPAHSGHRPVNGHPPQLLHPEPATATSTYPSPGPGAPQAPPLPPPLPLPSPPLPSPSSTSSASSPPPTVPVAPRHCLPPPLPSPFPPLAPPLPPPSPPAPPAAPGVVTWCSFAEDGLAARQDLLPGVEACHVGRAPRGGTLCKVGQGHVSHHVGGGGMRTLIRVEGERLGWLAGRHLLLLLMMMML